MLTDQQCFRIVQLMVSVMLLAISAVQFTFLVFDW